MWKKVKEKDKQVELIYLLTYSNTQSTASTSTIPVMDVATIYLSSLSIFEFHNVAVCATKHKTAVTIKVCSNVSIIKSTMFSPKVNINRINRKQGTKLTAVHCLAGAEVVVETGAEVYGVEKEKNRVI